MTGSSPIPRNQMKSRHFPADMKRSKLSGHLNVPEKLVDYAMCNKRAPEDDDSLSGRVVEGEWISIDPTISMFQHFWNIEATCNKI
jgi:hypothetical protein